MCIENSSVHYKCRKEDMFLLSLFLPHGNSSNRFMHPDHFVPWMVSALIGTLSPFIKLRKTHFKLTFRSNLLCKHWFCRPRQTPSPLGSFFPSRAVHIVNSNSPFPTRRNWIRFEAIFIFTSIRLPFNVHSAMMAIFRSPVDHANNALCKQQQTADTFSVFLFFRLFLSLADFELLNRFSLAFRGKSSTFPNGICVAKRFSIAIIVSTTRLFAFLLIW